MILHRLIYSAKEHYTVFAIWFWIHKLKFFLNNWKMIDNVLCILLIFHIQLMDKVELTDQVQIIILSFAANCKKYYIIRSLPKHKMPSMHCTILRSFITLITHRHSPIRSGIYMTLYSSHSDTSKPWTTETNLTCNNS